MEGGMCMAMEVVQGAGGLSSEGRTSASAYVLHLPVLTILISEERVRGYDKGVALWELYLIFELLHQLVQPFLNTIQVH